jgi:hypothetical protein
MTKEERPAVSSKIEAHEEEVSLPANSTRKGSGLFGRICDGPGTKRKVTLQKRKKTPAGSIPGTLSPITVRSAQNLPSPHVAVVENWGCG